MNLTNLTLTGEENGLHLRVEHSKMLRPDMVAIGAGSEKRMKYNQT